MIQDILPHLFDNTFIANANIGETDYIFHFQGNSLLLKQNEKKLEIPRKQDIPTCSSEGIFLFKLDDKNCFLIWECDKPKENFFAYHEIKFRNPFSQKEIDWASGVALQLKNWYLKNKFCGKCGTPTQNKVAERAIECPNCHFVQYPVISPAIIVALRCDNKILLARGANFPEGFFSLVAGYVDVGESIEDAVTREVKEEVGLDIKNIRYFGSQPWPFSGSMMMGFVADVEDNQRIQIDNLEIVEANWYSAENLPSYPQTRSIAGEMIEKFVKGEL